MFWIIFLSLLLLAIGWLLIAPIRVSVLFNEADHHLQVRWKGIFRVQLLTIAEKWLLQVRFFFFTKEWPLVQLMTKSEKKDRPQKKQKGNWRPKRPFSMLKRLLRSFRIIRFCLHMDTDDYPLNAYLLPFFQMITQKKKLDWQINFSGKNELLLIIDNRLYRLLYALFRDQLFFHQKK